MSDTGDFSVAITIPAGTVQSFFIYTTDIVLYSVGSLEGSLFSRDDSLEFYEGAGVTGKFSGQVVTPRVLNGQIRCAYRPIEIVFIHNSLAQAFVYLSYVHSSKV